MKNKFSLTISILTIGIFFLFGCIDNSTSNMETKVTELDTISFENLSIKSYIYLNEQQDICNEKYKMGTYQNWFYDQATGELTFSDNGVIKLIADYEEVGSVSLKTNTWLWAWANPNLEEKVKSVIGKIKDYGNKRNFEKLTNRKWTADEADGWEMTAIASYILKTKGAYRVPTSDKKLFSFMIFKNIRWADTTQTK